MLQLWDRTPFVHAFRPFATLDAELDRLVFGPRAASSVPAEAEAYAPRVDVRESADALILEADLPGLAADQVELKVEDGTLTLRGARAAVRAEGDRLHLAERETGGFERSFRLPPAFDTERVAASYEAGVLTIRLPRREELKPRSVRIEVK